MKAYLCTKHCTQTFIAALCEQPKYPSVREWTNMVWYVSTHWNTIHKKKEYTIGPYTNTNAFKIIRDWKYINGGLWIVTVGVDIRDEGITKRCKEFGVMTINLFVTIISCVYKYIKIYQTVCFQCVQFIAFQLIPQ